MKSRRISIVFVILITVLNSGVTMARGGFHGGGFGGRYGGVFRGG